MKEEVKNAKKNKNKKVKKVEETEKVEKVEEKKEKKEEKRKKSKKGIFVTLLVLLVLAAGGFVLKSILTKTTVTTETVEMPSDARGFANYFKEYIYNRVKAEKLFSYDFRDLGSEEILDELAELKDGFSKVSRGLSGNYKNSEYVEMAAVMESDSALYLTAVRELRTVMTGDYGSDGDRQLAFMRKVEETTGELRSALYFAGAAFEEDTKISGKGVVILEGDMLIEVGGGVMNVLVGDYDKNVVAMTTDDFDDTKVKAIEAVKAFGYTGTRLVKVNGGLKQMLEEGWLKNIELEVDMKEAKVTTTRISLVFKNLWSMNEELEGQGIYGLANRDEKVKSGSERLEKVLTGIKK